MKIYYSQTADRELPVEEDYTPVKLRESIAKTRKALEIAYSGFDNAVDSDMIDCYIYQINSLQKQYKHLSDLAALETASDQKPVRSRLSIRALMEHVFS